MARLVNIAENMPLPLDEYGELEDDYIDAEAFRSEIPDMEDYEDFIEDLYAMLTDKKDQKTSLEVSAESHYIGFAAEESRKNGGKPIVMN